MKLIAHRGNINGPNLINENNPDYLLETIKLGYDCEIDVHFVNNELFLGHDFPTYKININYLLNNCNKFWIHCKNLEALDYLYNFNELNIFWHENDRYTLTSKKYIWSYIGVNTTKNVICVMPELAYTDSNFIEIINNKIVNNNLYGICTDYCSYFK